MVNKLKTHIKLLRSECARYRNLLKFNSEDTFSDNELCRSYLSQYCDGCPLSENSGMKCGELYGEWFIHQMSKHKNPENWIVVCHECRKLVNKIINELTEIIREKQEIVENEKNNLDN